MILIQDQDLRLLYRYYYSVITLKNKIYKKICLKMHFKFSISIFKCDMTRWDRITYMLDLKYFTHLVIATTPLQLVEWDNIIIITLY